MSNDLPALLQTKLHRPAVTPTLVKRPRILEHLDQGLDRPLTLVCAPAGFGKTTLVSSWLESLQDKPQDSGPIQAAWLTLDHRDSEAAVFLYYMITAIRKIFPGACASTFDILRAPQPPPQNALLTSLSNEIEQLDGQFILTLDDYHTIQGDAVHNLLSELLYHWPRPLHLVLISRSNPPLPLARIRANDQLTEIRSRDLRFNREEIADFFIHSLRIPLPESTLEKLENKTDGWAVALRFTAQAMRPVSNIQTLLASLEGSRETLQEYLVDEILSRQFPAIEKFLLRTSILDRFSAPLCEALLGEQDPAWNARDSIGWLERQELFIIPLDQHKQWYRYHRLFQDLLQRRLSALLTPGQIEDLHRRAATWFIQRGMSDEALHHAMLAHEIDLVSDLMQNGLRQALDREDQLSLRRWLGMLPKEAIPNHPWLLMLKAWSMHFSWRLGLISGYLDETEALIDAVGSEKYGEASLQLLRGQIATLRAQDAYFHNQTAQAKAYCREAMAYIPPSWKFLHGGITFYLGLSMQADGEGEDAQRMLLNRYENLEEKADAYTMRLLMALCFNYLSMGQLEKTRQTAEVMLQQAIGGELLIVQGWAHFFLGAVDYQWNDLDSAKAHFARIDEHRYRLQRFVLQNGLLGLALVHRARGDIAEGLRIIDLASQMDIEAIGHEEDATGSLRAWLMFHRGDLERAFRWADAYTAPVPDQPLIGLEVPHLTRARLLLARNRATDAHTALGILDSLHEIAERTHNTRYRIEILGMRALALEALGKLPEAEDQLEQAIEQSKPGGFLRAFVDLGPDVQGILERLALKDHSAATIERILAAFPGGEFSQKLAGAQSQFIQQSSVDDPFLAEPLTPRELQVLAQFQEPISFKVIAIKLGITHSTVKRHSINIYGKLGVNSRWEAVAKAADLGILSAR